MKLITLKCPNCASPLQVDSSLRTAKCEFCGYEIWIDAELGIDNSTAAGGGSSDNRKDNNMDMDKQLQLVRLLIEASEKCETLRSEIKKLKKQGREIVEEEDAYCENQIWEWYIKPELAPVIFFLLIPNLLFKLIPLLVGVIYFVVMYRRRSNTIKSYEEDKAELRTQILEKQAQVETLSGQKGFELILEEHRTPDALNYIYYALKNHLAGTIPEAIDLYEDHLIKKKQYDT